MLRFMRSPLRRFLKYLGVGCSTFLLDLLLLVLFIDLLGINHLLAAALAFLIAVSINYAISRAFVFKGTLRQVGSGYAIFLCIAGMGLALVVVGMYVLTDLFGIHYLIARICIASIVGFWNYLMNLFVNFKVAGK